jgi:hypothetical protein
MSAYLPLVEFIRPAFAGARLFRWWLVRLSLHYSSITPGAVAEISEGLSPHRLGLDRVRGRFLQ